MPTTLLHRASDPSIDLPNSIAYERPEFNAKERGTSSLIEVTARKGAHSPWRPTKLLVGTGIVMPFGTPIRPWVHQNPHQHLSKLDGAYWGFRDANSTLDEVRPQL